MQNVTSQNRRQFIGVAAGPPSKSTIIVQRGLP